MAGGEDQNPASSSPELTGEVVGSDEGLTTISFWGLDGGEMWPAGAGGGKVADRALLRCRHNEVRSGARCQCTGMSHGWSRNGGRATTGPGAASPVLMSVRLDPACRSRAWTATASSGGWLDSCGQGGERGELDDVDEVAALALRPRGPGGRLTCRGTLRGSARGLAARCQTAAMSLGAVYGPVEGRRLHGTPLVHRDEV
jgi:hypothetical protein